MNNLPVFLQEPETYSILQDIIKSIPKSTKFYIVGGAMRNAMFYFYFKKKLPQRDFDSVIIGNHKKFIENLRNKGFVYGKIRRKSQTVLRKRKFPHAKEFRDFVTLDMHWQKNGNIIKNLKEHSSFTMSAFAIEIRDLFGKYWRKRVISLPNSLRDLKTKKLKVIAIDNKYNLFAAMRFMHIGFKQPSKSDTQKLLKEFEKAPKRRREKNIKKLLNYVGGKKEARRLAKKMDLNLNELISKK